VSRSAVSLVLNGRAEGNISAANQQAVREAARTLQYAPNAVALSLRTRTSRTLGVLVWGGPDPGLWQILHAALSTAADFGYLLLVKDTVGDPDHEEEAIKLLRAHQVDGFLVIAPESGPHPTSPALRGLPAVLANCHDPEGALVSVTTEQGDPESLASVGDRAVRLLLEELTSNSRAGPSELSGSQPAMGS